MRFVFFGSSEFAKIILQRLLVAGMRPFLVITTPSRPKGRKKIISPTPVYTLAQKEKIPVLAPDNLEDEEFLDNFKKQNPDLAILTAYGKILPASLLAIPQKGFVNLHPSLLPKWRGATPIQSAILAGESKTGVSLMVIDEQLDHGPIIQQEAYNIPAGATYSQMKQDLAVLGADLIIKTIPIWRDGKIPSREQNHDAATYCRKILPADEKINWRQSAEEIDRQARALNPNPGVFTLLDERVMKITEGRIINLQESDQPPGTIMPWEDKLAVQCAPGTYAIEKLKPSGKNEMNSIDFLRGHPDVLGKIFH